MKKCPYCGTEYPDEATVCAIDRETLLEHPPKPTVEEAPAPASAAKAATKSPVLLWPDYQWRAKDAWKCIGIITCLAIIYAPIGQAVSRTFHAAYYSPIGVVVFGVFFFAAWVITACYFARTETFDTCLRAFGFDQKPTNYAWFGITMILLIRGSTHLMYTHHLGPGTYNYEYTEFRKTIGPERWLFLFSPLILAPLLEEAVNRGFLYKAFRNSYSMPVSVIVMVAWTCWTHWGYYYESWIAALQLSAWTVLQCYLREKSPSLWDCVIPHCASNALILIF
ncbi:MAG TPA: type II CAAX endopeptidase family protein [Candidatus Sulfotelmatobacter sp.]|nr:type II CAAX endopeptidase family protein [Candidatus Sulfotelmatobacter sp.]